MSEEIQNDKQADAQQDQPVQAQQTNSQQGQNQGNTGSSVDNSKLWAVLGYIIPFLFFIPLVMEDLKNNSFSKFHANQQLVLLIAGIVINIVGTIIPFLGWFLILPIGSIFLLVVVIIGIINAAKGEQKPLPVIGGFNILK